MSRAIVSHVDYGRHIVSRYHPRVDQIVWSMDVLGAIMDHCTAGTKVQLARTCRQLYKLLCDRIAHANIHIKWPNLGGRGLKTIEQMAKLRKIITIVGNLPDVIIDNYAELIPPKCEHCNKWICKEEHKHTVETVWRYRRVSVITLYVGYCARTIRSYMCNMCFRLFAGSDHDIAVARMRIVNDLDNYDKFYSSLVGHYISSKEDKIYEANLALAKYFTFVLDRTVMRKHQILRWVYINNHDMRLYLAQDCFPFYALKLDMLHKITKTLSLRDIRSMKCVSKLQKIVFRGMETVTNYVNTTFA